VSRRDELLLEIGRLRAMHTTVSAMPRLSEIEALMGKAHGLLGGCPHEFDDGDRARSGDPCMWCDGSKP
jgi:hypothetical protein